MAVVGALPQDPPPNGPPVEVPRQDLPVEVPREAEIERATACGKCMKNFAEYYSFIHTYYVFQMNLLSDSSAFYKLDPPKKVYRHCSVLHLNLNYPHSSGTCTRRIPANGAEK